MENPDSTRQRRTVLIDEAAVRLGVSRRTVYYRISEGRLQTIRTRCGSQRVLLSSIEALLRHEEAAKNSRDGGVGAMSQPETLALEVQALPRDS
jgi:excisionase family DNA binding protein